MNPTPGTRPDWVDDTLLPFDSHFVDIDGCNIHYLDEGSGPLLLMLHGNPTWSFLYRDLIHELSDSYRCVAPDYPGMGLSQAREGYAFGPEEHARILQRLVAQLDLTDITLIAQDWGGPIGMAAAAAEPDRYTRLILGNTWFWPFDDLRSSAFSWFMGGPVGSTLHRHANTFVERIIPFMHSRRKPGPPEMAMWRGPYPTPESREPTHVFPERVTGAKPFLAQTLYDVQASGLLEKPALLIRADADVAFTESMVRRMEDMFTDSRVAIIRGANHFWQDDAPADAAMAIREWLNRR